MPHYNFRLLFACMPYALNHPATAEKKSRREIAAEIVGNFHCDLIPKL